MNTTSINTCTDPDLVSADVVELSKEFNAFAQKTAEGILAMGLTVAKAKRLSASDFETFCKLIRYESDSSAIRKLEQIGKRYDALHKHVDKLPSTWTTIYRLCTLDDSAIDASAASGALNPTIKGSDLIALCGTAKNSRGAKNGKSTMARTPADAAVPNGTDMVVRFTTTIDETQILTLRRVCTLLREVDAEIALSHKLDAVLNQAVEMKEAA